jgi:hypothetical protein
VALDAAAPVTQRSVGIGGMGFLKTVRRLRAHDAPAKIGLHQKLAARKARLFPALADRNQLTLGVLTSSQPLHRQIDPKPPSDDCDVLVF